MTERQRRRRILFVCTANICRSPAAELLARTRVGEHDLMFRSAGFLMAGTECPPELVGVLRERGIDATAHRSYTIDKASIEAADLILTMEGSHVQKATVIQPPAFPKIVPLREAAAVVERATTARLTVEEFIEELNRDRDARQYLGTEWDVADPYGGRVKGYQKAVAEIEQLVTSVVSRLS